MTTSVQEKNVESEEPGKIPQPFIVRRFHSLLGLWLTIYLTEHLLVNSQAAFFFQDEMAGFVAAVNRIHEIPYLKAVEILFLALPFLFHGLWGIYYAWSARLNAHITDGTTPSLPQYPRNRAFSWQRITAWLLLFGILAHVIHMRFVHYPIYALQGSYPTYLVNVYYDPGLPLIAKKLKATLYDSQQLQDMKNSLEREKKSLSDTLIQEKNYNPAQDADYSLQNRVEEEEAWLQAALKKTLKTDQVLVATPNAGGAFFIIVREAFKRLSLVILYSLLVIAAVFHGFNGLWTFCIKWGLTLTRRSQRRMRTFSSCLMGFVMILGLISAWGTYWMTHMVK